MPAAGFAALALFLYFGEIYGAANSCIIYNDVEEERFVEEVESGIGLERVLQNPETTD